jgi:hypothetical protein
MADATKVSGITNPRRILALEIRSQRFAFVALEGMNVIDFGIRRCRSHSGSVQAVTLKRFVPVVDFCVPTAAVIRKRLGKSSQDPGTMQAITKAIRAQCRRRAIQVYGMSEKKVQSFFAKYGATTKHATASLLAEWFEELAWKLPPKRKPWQSERPNTLLFDALAVAMAFLGAE